MRKQDILSVFSQRGEEKWEDGGVTEAAAGDRWSERMNGVADSHAQLSAGSKKERLTAGQSM